MEERRTLVKGMLQGGSNRLFTREKCKWADALGFLFTLMIFGKMKPSPQ